MKRTLAYFVSFSAGALFGDAFIHLIPGAVAEYGFGVKVSLYVLSGILISFLVEKVIHWRHTHTTRYHLHARRESVQPFALMNLFGEAVHNLIDGLIIGAGYLVSVPVGVATTLAVIFHEIPAELGDFGVLVHGGMAPRKALLFNFLVALTAVVGAITALVVSSLTRGATTFLVPFAAGCFIYIAGSNLIPELQKEIRPVRSLLQFVTLILGIAVMLVLTFFE